MSILGVSNEVENQIIKLAQKYSIQKIIVFGSRARGDYRKTSDIDLAVTGGNVAAFSIDVEEDVATLLQFDVIDLDKRVQPELLDSINSEGKVIYEKI